MRASWVGEPMKTELSRRRFLEVVGAVLIGCSRNSERGTDATRQLADIERRVGGRLGVHALDTGNSASISHRATERFAMCSTFKWALGAAVLSRVERAELTLDQQIAYGERDLLQYAPAAKANLSRGHMTIAELVEAAVTVSDNTAANLLLAQVGGPGGLTRYLRDHGDPVTRLDRDEPMLNTNEKGDPRDTTTPSAMVSTLRALLTTSLLTPASQNRLIEWMVACKTGQDRLKAGLPAAWRVGHKTGSGNHGAINDVAIAWPPGRAPILIAVYASESASSEAALANAHAEVGRTVASCLGK